MHRHPAVSGEYQRRETVPLRRLAKGAVGRGRPDFLEDAVCRRIVEPGREAAKCIVKLMSRYWRQDHRARFAYDSRILLLYFLPDQIMTTEISDLANADVAVPVYFAKHRALSTG
jgi:hypothetical protein